MRVTDNRYRHERRQFDLAVRMLRHEARTCTIKQCTGLSDDRIRRLYHSYFEQRGEFIRRWRGKPPRQITYFFRRPSIEAEATTLISLFSVLELVPKRPDFPNYWPSVERGVRFCDAFELYLAVHETATISFERAWYLLDSFRKRRGLTLLKCRRCRNSFVHDTLSIPARWCPCCRVKDAPAR